MVFKMEMNVIVAIKTRISYQHIPQVVINDVMVIELKSVVAVGD